jgi:hypothetical protein
MRRILAADAHGACVEWRRVASSDGVGVMGSAIDRPDRAFAFTWLTSHRWSHTPQAAIFSMASPRTPPTSTMVARDFEFTTVELPDRRTGDERKKWMFQSELEYYLYGNHTTKGSMFRLLARSGADGRSLCLKRKSVDESIVTDAEFKFVRDLINPGARAFTLVPIDAVEMALIEFGSTPKVDALASALGLEPIYILPDEDGGGGDEESEDGGGESEESKDEESEDEESEDDESEDDESEDDESSHSSDSKDDDDSADEGGDASGGFDNSSDGSESDDGGGAVTDVEEEPPSVDVVADEAGSSGRQRASSAYALEEAAIPAGLEAELIAFAKWRISAINRDRKGIAVAATTAVQERNNVLRLLGWLRTVKKLVTPTMAIFASPQIGLAVQRYVELLNDQGRKWSTLSMYVGSFVAAARFVHAQRAVGDSSSSIDQLEALHVQTLQRARQQTAFDLANPPPRWLDWSDVQRARCTAEEALAALDGKASPLKRQQLTRDVALLMMLTYQPPDRVGITRTLQLSGSLKPTKEGFVLDLSKPGMHKTAAVFGPSTTSVPVAIASQLRAHLTLSAVPEGGFVFGKAGNPLEALPPNQWTALVKQLFRRYSGVALSPKDLRSSFVTFLKSGEHSDEALRAAAHAMRHSSKTQDSVHYHKGKSDALIKAAVEAAAKFASQFQPR